MDELIGTVIGVAGCVDYARGAVVSKQIIKKDVGTVTVFAFDTGEGLSEHTAPFDAMVHIIDGKAEVIIEGKSFFPAAGEMIIMPAHKPHALKAHERFKMMLIMIQK